MPVHYRILSDPPLIVTFYVGNVSSDNYYSVYDAIFADPAYVPGMDELCDTRPMQAFDVQFSALKAVAELVVETLGPSASLMRTAVVQGTDVNASVTKLYAAVAEMYEKETLAMFPTLKEAAAWLDIDSASVPVLENSLQEMRRL